MTRGDGALGALGAARARAAAAAARRSASAPEVIVTNPGQAQFGIIQGGTYPGAAHRERRRRRSTIGFEAYAIGGLSVGEPADVMYDVVGAHGAAAAGRTGRAT